MAYVQLNLTTLLFEDEIEIWSGDDEYPEQTVTLAELFEGYVENLTGGYGHEEAEEFILTTLGALEHGKGLLLDALERMKARNEAH